MTIASPHKRRILVADDVPGTVLFLSRALSKRGFEVQTAEDGEQCLRLIREFRPDLVILDIMMPKVHGIDVLKAVRADEEMKDTGFIICSVRSFNVDTKNVKDLGAFDVLDKPLELQQVLEKVDAFFAGRDPAHISIAGGVAAGAKQGTQEVFKPALDSSRGFYRMWG